MSTTDARTEITGVGTIGVPVGVDDVSAEFRRLRDRGVRFTQEPREMGPVTTAVFDDTCAT